MNGWMDGWIDRWGHFLMGDLQSKNRNTPGVFRINAFCEMNFNRE